jgi:hypothetical protein
MNVDLHDELLRMAAQDEAVTDRLARHARPGTDDGARSEGELADLARVREVRARNTARMRAIVRRHGWPGWSLVGDDGAAAAWLLVQHAGADRAFQRGCVALLQQAVSAGEAPGAHLAFLTDRVLLADGTPQRYGTQMDLVDGRWVPAHLSDPEGVDDRRRSLDLEPLEAYCRRFR